MHTKIWLLAGTMALLCSCGGNAMEDHKTYSSEADIGADEISEVDDQAPSQRDEATNDENFARWMKSEGQDGTDTSGGDALVAAKSSGGCAGARLKIVIKKGAQRLFVTLNGKPMLGGGGILVSTGLPGKNETNSGTFCAGPPSNKRKSNFATKMVGHTVYLYNVIPFNAGQWLHAASAAGQAYLGHKRSHGCVRVDKNYAPMLYRLAAQNAGSIQVTVQ